MKKILFIASLILCQTLYAQNKGTVKGILTDKEMDNEALAFANVYIKGTTIGETTDMDGGYSLSVPAGPQTIVFSFLGYKTIEKAIDVKANEAVIINLLMAAEEGVALDEIKITATVGREKESALLLEQKKASVIVESIGAERLSKTGVSDAASATTKIAGVTRSEGSGAIYVRGLGDRYLSTTMNKLSIPSDDVEKKNINLNLFSTAIIQNVGISKTFITSSYADQASGTINVETKEYSRKEYTVGLSAGANTNVINVFGDFRRTVMSDDVTLGFHQKQFAVVDLITRQSWDTKSQNAPVNYNISLSGSQKFDVFGKDLSFLASASHSKSFSYQTGDFKSFRSNILDTSFSDATLFSSTTATNAYGNLSLKINQKNKVSFNALFVGRGEDNLYEQGRNGLGYVFDQDPQEEGAFVRDQNFKQTLLFVNQFLGEHQLTENNELKWAAGYNFILAEEPNRIRNEVNILDITTSTEIQYAHVGDFQQRKSSQKIEDTEFNGFIEDNWSLGLKDENENRPYKLNFGVNFRKKERTFNSIFVGVRARDFTAQSIDNLSNTFTQSGFNNGLILKTREADRYNADLNIIAGYLNFDFNLGEISGNIGARYERDEINIIWDVANYVGRAGSLNNTYNNFFPSINLKYQLNEKHFLRFASSVTQTLPEFKELAPFEYVSPVGRVTKGNPNLEKSEVYNIDLKWEFFPKRSELLSATAFYKLIENPINLSQTRGSSGNFEFSNTGKEANIYGLEFEGRLDLLENQNQESLLNLSGNITKMWLTQDLLENFQYKNITKSGLQGASDFILNAALSYNNQKEKEFIATLATNYSSDKIYSLGSPEDKANSSTFFNDEIIEKGFLTMDFVLSKELTKNLTAKFTGRNLLNPEIKQTQNVTDVNTNIETTQTVLSYKKGSQLTLSLKYTF
jgi:outer membrane receptor protein involved in Fe transport